MFQCDPILILLFVILLVLIGFIVREMAIHAGMLQGVRLFSGDVMGGDDSGSVAGGMVSGGTIGGECTSCGGYDINDALN